MTIKLSSFGGGGVFMPKFASSGLQVSSGSTGTLVTLTPPAGQRVRLFQLIGAGTMTSFTTITIGGATVVNALRLSNAASTSIPVPFYLIGGQSSAQSLTGELDEVLIISTDVATSHTINYAYQFGV